MLAGLLLAVGVEGFRRWREAVALERAADAVQGELARARMLAVRRGEVVRVRLAASGRLRLEAASGQDLSGIDLSRGSLRVDSARIAPPWFRFNSRGQAAPGSVYLYRGSRGVRLVSNFLGRMRRERFRVP